MWPVTFKTAPWVANGWKGPCSCLQGTWKPSLWPAVSGAANAATCAWHCAMQGLRMGCPPLWASNEVGRNRWSPGFSRSSEIGCFRAGVRLPRVFCNMSRETEADGSSATSILLMEDLSAAPFRRCTNSLDDLKLATTALAQFHAATMGEKDFLAELSKEGFVAENLTQAALDSWQEIVKLAAETPEEAARWSIEIADLVSGLASCAKATATQPGSEALCLIHGDFRSDHVIIEGKEVILMAFSHAKVATPALDLASLVTSSQSFACLNQLLDLYCQLLPAQSMAELRQIVRLACLQLALKPMEVKPPLDSRKLRLWVDFLWTLLNEMDARWKKMSTEHCAYVSKFRLPVASSHQPVTNLEGHPRTSYYLQKKLYDSPVSLVMRPGFWHPSLPKFRIPQNGFPSSQDQCCL